MTSDSGRSSDAEPFAEHREQLARLPAAVQRFAQVARALLERVALHEEPALHELLHASLRRQREGDERERQDGLRHPRLGDECELARARGGIKASSADRITIERIVSAAAAVIRRSMSKRL